MRVKKLRLVLFILFLLFFKINVRAQISLQINAGLMNYGGDLQNKPFTFNKSQLTAGASIMYRLNNFGLRAGINHGNVEADDKETSNYALRNLNFKSAITEVNFCLEYDFLSADNDHKLIPYIFAGIGVYHFNPYTIYNSRKVYLKPLSTEGEGLAIYPNRKPYSLTSFEDPFGIGVRYRLSSNFLLGIEFNSRLLYTDYLDDVSTKYPDENELFKDKGQLAVDLSYRGDEIQPGAPFPVGRVRGNPRQNDNYYTSIITLTYIFPDHALFGNVSGHGRHKLSCPKKVH